MTKIIDKTEIQRLHKELDAVLAAFAEKNGLTVSKFPLKYSATSFRTGAIDFALKNGDGPQVDPRFARDLARSGWMHGLTKEMIGTPLTLPGSKGRSQYKFAGMRASKAVAICDTDGKPYLWDAAFIAQQIKLQAKA